MIWAPEFPLHSDALGFWDHLCYLEHRVDRLFTVTLLLEDGQPLPLKLKSRTWTPPGLTQTYAEHDGLEVVEAKTYLNDALVSRVTIRSTAARARRLQAVVWTLHRRGEAGEADSLQDDRIREGRIELLLVCPGMFDSGPQQISVAIGMDRAPRSSSLNASEGAFELPLWEVTPFYEMLTDRGLPGDHKPFGGAWGRRAEQLVFAALEIPLELPSKGQAVFTAGAALGPSAREAGSALADVLSADAVEESEAAWAAYWENVPSFTCDDPYLERAYWYRWFGLRLNTVLAGSTYNLPHACVFEGINHGWFRHAISYSSPALIRDLRWAKEPTVAQGCLLNFVANQRADGSFPGGIATTPISTYEGFYHANWGSAVRSLNRVHPDSHFLKRVYGPLKSYASYFQEERDHEGWHLYDVLDQWETGQEYMSRYDLADSPADQGGPIRLKGVDASCYLYELYRTLGWMARHLDLEIEAASWDEDAAATAEAIRGRLWDPNLGFFTDLNPGTGRRGTTLAAVGFYPFMSDLAQPQHLVAIREHLFDAQKFWTEYPVPSTALTDWRASAYGEWKQLRTNCPWNGRSWLMTNSHVCEALGHAALTLDPNLRAPAAELIRRCIRETFIDGDVRRPSSFEYYNPINGKAPFFRGTDDYMHSWVIDLIIQYAAGVRPGDGDLVLIDPLDFGLETFSLEDVWVKGHRLDVQWAKGEGLSVRLDGVETARRDDLGRLELRLEL